MNLERVADEVDNPVIHDAGASVEARLVLVVDPIGSLCDLDDEHGPGRVRVAISIGIARDHGDVGLWLRVRVERDRKLRIDLPRIAERATKSRQDAPDRRGVPTSLRLANDQETGSMVAPASFVAPETVTLYVTAASNGASGVKVAVFVSGS